MSSSPRTCMRSSSRPDASRSATRRASRTGVTTCRVTSQVTPATSSSSSAPPVSRAPADQGRVLLLLGHREQVVQRVGAAVGRESTSRVPTATPGTGPRSASVIVVKVHLVPRGLLPLHLVAQRFRHAVQPQAGGEELAADRRSRTTRSGEGADQHDVVAPHRAARDDTRHQRGELRRRVEVGRRARSGCSERRHCSARPPPRTRRPGPARDHS